MNANLQEQLRQRVSNLKDVNQKNLLLEKEIDEAKISNKMLVQHTRMCEQRIKSAENQISALSKELKKCRDDSLMWKNDRQDIGKYALSLEEALRKSHKYIQTLRVVA